MVNQPSELKGSLDVFSLSCEDQFDANIVSNVYGATAPYSYSWTNGASSEDISNVDAGTYNLVVTDAQNCTLTLTAVVYDIDKECVDPVNTFTPNDDDYNDTWYIPNMDLYPNASVKVFNKWGGLVYETKGTYTPWDGTFEGAKLPADVYYYIIELNNTKNYKYTGSITIIR
jgi:large repetitive protein